MIITRRKLLKAAALAAPALILPSRLLARSMHGGGGGGGGYVAKAVRFNAGAYLARGSVLTGASNSPTGTIFYWFRSDPAVGIGQNVVATIPNYYLNPYDLGTTMNTSLADGTNAFLGSPGSTFPDPPPPDVDDGDWYGIARSWDVSDANPINWKCVTVVGEPSEAPAIWAELHSPIKTGTGFDVVWNETDFYVMGDGFEDVFRDVAQMWATPGVFMTGAQMIAAFWGADNKPKSLGVNGEGPTGSPPAIYCDGLAATWAANLGTGGSFSGVGDPITDVVDGPSA